MAKANCMKIALVLEATAKMEGIKRANKQLKDLQFQVRKLQPLLNLTKKALLGLGGMGYIFYRLVDAAHKLGDEVTKLAAATGASSTDLQVLGRVAAQNGAKLEDMSKGLLTLTKSTQATANGNKGLADRFARLGIDLAKFKTLSPERQMERLGIAVNAASDKQAAFAEVMALVGQEAGPKLIESFKKLGTEGFGELSRKTEHSGHVLSAEAIKNLDRITQAFKDLGYWIKVATAEAIGGIIKLGEKIAEATKTSAQAAEAKFGLDNWVTSETYRVEAAQKLA